MDFYDIFRHSVVVLLQLTIFICEALRQSAWGRSEHFAKDTGFEETGRIGQGQQAACMEAPGVWELYGGSRSEKIWTWNKTAASESNLPNKRKYSKWSDVI